MKKFRQTKLPKFRLGAEILSADKYVKSKTLHTLAMTPSRSSPNKVGMVRADVIVANGFAGGAAAVACAGCACAPNRPKRKYNTFLLYSFEKGNYFRPK